MEMAGQYLVIAGGAAMKAEMPEASLPDNNSHTMEERRASNDTTALTPPYSKPRCLMELIVAEDNVDKAVRRVKKKKGCPGVDRVTVVPSDNPDEIYLDQGRSREVLRHRRPRHPHGTSSPAGRRQEGTEVDTKIPESANQHRRGAYVQQKPRDR